MIPFTMKILSYNAGCYTVEYVPEVTYCKPIKLSIQLDQDTLHDKDRVLERLKQASPQEFWYHQIVATESTTPTEVAGSLMNTNHKVTEVPPATVTPVTSYSFHPVRSPSLAQRQAQVALPSSTAQAQQGSSTVGSSTPEQVAPHEEQNIIKLKILIQQVIQEMAEGTV